MKKIVHSFVLRATIPNVPIELPFHGMHRYDSWPSRACKKNSVGIFEYILASMLKVYLDVF